MYLKTDENKTFNILIKSFTDSFNSVLSTFTHDEKKEILRLAPVIFSKWYYSSLFEDSILSSANIFEAIEANDSNGVLGVKLTLDDNISHPCFKIQLYQDSAYNHSFINDLRTLADCCRPAAAIEKNGTISEEILQKLVNADIYYFNYLFNMAEVLGIIKPMASINTLKYQVDENKYSAFFSQEVPDILRQVADNAINMFIEEFNIKMQVPFTIVTSASIKKFLSESPSADELYSSVYSALGFNFEKLLSLAEKGSLSSEEEILMSSAYFMGTIFDKWLFTPLGHYLKLITPLYSTPYNFMAEADLIRPLVLTGCDISSEIFSSCNYFKITAIGERVFGFKNKRSVFGKLSETFTLQQIEALISSYLKMSNVSLLNPPYLLQTVYSLKIEYFYNKDKWKIVELGEKSSLRRLYEQIIIFFGIEKSQKHAFYIVNKNNALNKTRINNPDIFTLNNVDWENNNILLSDGFDRFMDMVISLSEITQSRPGASYPRLLKQSREITIEEREDY